MSESNIPRLLLGVVVGVGVFALATWLSRDGDSDDPQNAEGEPSGRFSLAEPSTTANMHPSPFRIAEHGRLSVDRDALPNGAPFRLALDLPDDARSDDFHTIRIVSADGRRIETTARPLAGEGTGIQLEIDSSILAPGLYMIEIDTVEKTPLRIRRYVLEVN